MVDSEYYINLYKNTGIVPIIGNDSSGFDIAKIMALEEKRHKLPPLPLLFIGFAQQLPYEETLTFDLNMKSFKKSIEMCRNSSYILNIHKKTITVGNKNKPNLNVLYRYSKGLYTSCNLKKLN